MAMTIQNTEQFFVCKYKAEHLHSSDADNPWVGIDYGSGGYPYPAAKSFMEAHRWPLSKRNEAFEFATKGAAKELEVYLVTAVYSNSDENNFSVKASACPAWAPDHTF